MHWYLEVFRKYAVFEGRARRKEYWTFFLFHSVIFMVLALFDEAMDLKVELDDEQFRFLSTLYGLFTIIPGLAVLVRRLHDTEKSGLWLLIGLIPLFGAITLLVFTVRTGNRGTNRYGSDPKETKTW